MHHIRFWLGLSPRPIAKFKVVTFQGDRERENKNPLQIDVVAGLMHFKNSLASYEEVSDVSISKFSAVYCKSLITVRVIAKSSADMVSEPVCSYNELVVLFDIVLLCPMHNFDNDLFEFGSQRGWIKKRTRTPFR